MQTIFKDYKKVNTSNGTAVAIGNFDGLHKGHIKLLDTLKEKAEDQGIPSVVYTFSEHPKNAMTGKGTQKLIYDNVKKEKLFANACVNTLFFEDFMQVCNLSPEEFVKEILVDKFNIKVAVIGENGRFGKKSEGDAEKLKELGIIYGFEVFVVEPLMLNGVTCSSTEIRDAINSGAFEKCKNLLGRNYSVTGEVVGDKHLGRTYGFPTANIIPENCRPSIKRGVYATNTLVGNKIYKSITNVGTTSFDAPEKERIETYILDFNGDLYGETIEVEFLYYMRDFKCFVSTDELKEQLDEDKKERKFGGC